MKHNLAFLIAAMLVIACQKGEFLFYQTKPKTVPVGMDHQLKEIKGQKEVDILWVIDNSGSMSAHQRAVKNNADLFMKAFLARDLHWRMGIISTSIFEEPYLGMDVLHKGNNPLNFNFDHNTTNPMKNFGDAVSKLGTRGNGEAESTFAPVWDALNQYPEFLRPNAVLAILIVTDAPEQSYKLNPKGGYTSPYLGPAIRQNPNNPNQFQRIAYRPLNKAPTTARQFYDDLLDRKKDPKKVIVYGAFAAVDLGCQIVDEFENYYGSEYENIVKLTNGKVFPLCAKDFGKNLANFGEDLASRLSHPAIFLKERPLVNSLRVTYRGQPLRGGLPQDNGQWFFDYENNSVLFYNLDFAQGDDEKVRVEYEVQAQ